MDLQTAAMKWQRNAQAGSKNWHGDVNRFCEGLSKFGLSPGQCASGIGARYQQGIQAEGQQAFSQAVAGASPEKWARRFLEGISR